MTPEELLKPRYEVIADYPNSPHRIGEIITLDRLAIDGFWWHAYEEGKSDHWEESTIAKYSAIFRKLKWWEKRKPEDMPKYVKSNMPENYWVLKCGSISMGYTLPATFEEYRDYVNKATK